MHGLRRLWDGFADVAWLQALKSTSSLCLHFPFQVSRRPPRSVQALVECPDGGPTSRGTERAGLRNTRYRQIAQTTARRMEHGIALAGATLATTTAEHPIGQLPFALGGRALILTKATKTLGCEVNRALVLLASRLLQCRAGKRHVENKTNENDRRRPTPNQTGRATGSLGSPCPGNAAARPITTADASRRDTWSGSYRT